MRKTVFSIFVLAFVFLVGMPYSVDAQSKRGKHKVVFPVFETPALFVGEVGETDVVLFVDHSDETCISGRYLTLDEDGGDTIPFRLVALRRRARLFYDGNKETFRPDIVSLDESQAQGVAHLNLIKKMDFSIRSLESPLFEKCDEQRYADSLFSVKEISDIPYARAKGYWSHLHNSTATFDKISMMTQAIDERLLDLHLDVFMPEDDTLQSHPLVVLMHGGAFYFGSKDDDAITGWCRHLASMGYVTASIDYRIGFLPTLPSIQRAGYRAVQDAHAAVRYLVAHHDEYDIDTSLIFVGGCSAGAITALNLAYMTNDSRPEFSYSGFGRNDLGAIDTCGNAIKADFTIKGIVDMWGALPDTVMMRGSSIPILAFHGDNDDIVPYAYDYPFRKAGVMKSAFAEKMYGSSCIVDRAQKMGTPAKLVTFMGYRHSPHLDPQTNEFNDIFYTIQEMMDEFFYDIIAPDKPAIVEHNKVYSLQPEPLKVSWQVEGGVILSSEEKAVKVAWINNAPLRQITVSAVMPHGICFNDSMVIGE